MSGELVNLQSVLDNSKSYESIQEKKTEGYDDALKALEIVREFIVKKKRILYGGMSVDISLKLAGHPGIYSDDVIPDYDFYSPEFEKDSYELADILHEAGFQNVNAIGAMHISSRRVRVNDVTVVADISYMPKPIYESMPFLKHKKIRIVHPIFQRMDMHRAMSLPFENPPFEVISHRIKKDVTRFKMLNEEYDLPLEVKPGEVDVREVEVELKWFRGGVVGGVMAYNVMRDVLEGYVGKGSVLRERLVEAGMLASIEDKLGKSVAGKVERGGSGNVKIFVPKKLPVRVTVLTDSAEKLVESIGGEVEARYNMYGDGWKPKTTIVKKEEIEWEVLDNLYSKVSSMMMDEVSRVEEKISRGERKEKDGKKVREKDWGDVMLTSANGVMMYMLQKYNDYGTKESEKQSYLALYKSMLNLVEAAEQLVVAIKADKPDARAVYRSMPWFLTAESYGRSNESPSYRAFMEEKRYRVLNVPAEERKMLKPRHGYYPDNPEKPVPDFDVSESEFFEFDGAKVKKEKKK